MFLDGILSAMDSVHGAKNTLRNHFFGFYGGDCADNYCIDLTCHTGLDLAYTKCSPLNTVITRNAQTFANAEIYIGDKEKQEINTPNAKYTLDLLDKPHALFNKIEFFLTFDVYRQLYGYVYLMRTRAAGKTISLLPLPPKRVCPHLTGSFYFQNEYKNIVDYYEIILPNGNRQRVEPEDMLIVRDFHVNLDFCNNTINGLSRAVSLEPQIKNLIIANEALYSLNKDRGAMGILSNAATDVVGSIPLSTEEKIEIENQYNNLFGLIRNKAKIILSEKALNWQQISFNVRDLMLLEGMQECQQRVADMYNYPFGLLARTNGEKYSNKEIDTKELYQNGIIPISKLYTSDMSEFIGLNKGTYLYFDYSHVEALQEGESSRTDTASKKMDAIKKALDNGWITEAEAQEKAKIILDTIL